MKLRYSFSSRKTKKIENIGKQRKKYPEIAREVVGESDILLEVLDARFADEMRNKDLEEFAKSGGKKIIFVLNKSDLLKKPKKTKLKPSILVSVKTKKGISTLREILRIHTKKIKKSKVVVGVIGFPNTGKSSLINVLARSAKTKTSKQAGFTRGIQKIRLFENVVLLDTPGVISKDTYSTKREKFAIATIFGARSASDVRDPEVVVTTLFEKFKERLNKHYDIDANDSEEFLERLAESKKFLLKKGKKDTERAARKVLRDWQEGRIK
ncbi:hypothetical protein D6829_00960 [Candidatus Pacearchaeota archaeon]|nr:MAG: hypothetical protein D6829_00960 [Candidatus Pacearchaeota archaeon]